MQRISRIYLGNTGYVMAWYDGLLLDLTDPDTRQPVDTIINLENGGGKTSLLSLIFSCFDTSQDRFLKHLQSKNNHFSQYFSQDGLPGFIIVEWEMPPRTAGGVPYRLVVGQVVSIKAGNEAPEADRLFFSFEARGALTLESVPAPKLGTAPVTTLAEFSRWVHDEQKRYSDVYVTRKQADWQRHLREERLIDLEMLQMQVNFSVSEGGFDTGFLNFQTEAAFLQKFFHLTLDAQRASAVREAVATACDKLRRKPHYQSKLAALQKFRVVLHAFEQQAVNYRGASAAELQIRLRAARTALALLERANARREQARTTRDYAEVQQALGGTAGSEVLLHMRNAASMTSLLHVRAVNAARERATVAGNAVTTVNDAILRVRAARLAAEIQRDEQNLEERQAQFDLIQEGLKPDKDHLDHQGALLRAALYQQEQVLQETVKRIERETDERNGQTERHRKALAEDDRKRTLFTQEHSGLQAQETVWARERLAMVDSGRLEGPSESAVDAVNRWAEAEERLRIEEAAHKGEAQQHDEQVRRWRAEEVRLGTQAGQLTGQIQAKTQFIGEGTAERERLSQLGIILQAIEADVADPDSPALPGVLERVISASATEVSLSDVRLAELQATVRAINETGVAGNSPDVARVVAQLREAGVRSARPFNEYIADAQPDAHRARALVLSDPARFLGVSVAHSELEKARGLDWGQQKLTRPVVVSPLALDAAEDDTTPRLVVPAQSDAAYNRAAAQAQAMTLTEAIKGEDRRRKDFYARQTDALAALERLRAYTARFGDGKLGVAANELKELESQVQVLQERRTEAGEKATQATEAERKSREAAVERDQLAREAAAHIKALKQFIHNYDANRNQRLERMAELEQLLEELQGRKVTLEEEIQRLTDLTYEQNRLAVRADSDARGLGVERSKLEFYDKTLPAKERLAENPRDLETLRSAYEDALAVYKSKAEDKLGVLNAQMTAMRKHRDEKKAEYQREYRQVTKAQFTPYLNVEHDVLLPELQIKKEAAEREQREAERALGGVQSASNAWHGKNKEVASATPAMEALDDVALAQARDEAERQAEAASGCQQRANEESNTAKGRAKQLDEASAQDESLADMLRTTMKLERRPNVELLELELAQLSAGLGAVEAGEQQASALVLDENATAQVRQVMSDYGGKAKFREQAQDRARGAFDAVKKSATDPDLQKVEPELAAAMLGNDFGVACMDAGRLLEGLEDRIRTTQDNLEKMQADFDACVEEMVGLSRVALGLLNSALDKRVPATAPYVAGKAILKMRANFAGINLETRRQALTLYLDSIIQSNVLPAKGSDLVAEAVMRMYGGRPLGIQVLRMVIDETQQYLPVEKISNSGGEGVVMALFLYAVITQLRAETQAKLQKQAGGPLILDNPFAKATSPTMWRAQRLLAQSMGVQLVFATAIQDYNALAEFSAFVRLRRAGQNSKTGRWHLECVRYRLNGDVPASNQGSLLAGAV
jgi:hypothetical protein